MTDETHQLAVSFDRGADAYAQGRPGYPAAALRWALPPEPALVLDLAAGTGIVAAGLLTLGVPVVAVEPLPNMRRHIPRTARPLAGVAEAIPLRDAAVDAVVVGQAFHWFQQRAALAEISRVVRPGGTVGLMWNAMDDRVPWVAALATAIAAADRATVMLGSEDSPFGADEAQLQEVTRRFFTHEHEMDADALLANVASRSAVLVLPERERAAVLQRVAELAPAGRFRLPHVCQVWRARRG